jgi:hypothetical protein
MMLQVVVSSVGYSYIGMFEYLGNVRYFFAYVCKGSPFSLYLGI